MTPPLSTISSPPFGARASGAALSRSQQGFAAVLSGARNRATAPAPERSTEARAREAAESLVAVTLVQPILAQLRESSDAPPPFAPTPAERQFGALQDAALARDIVRRAQFPLVEKVARGVLRHLGPGQTTHPLAQGDRPHATGAQLQDIIA